MYVMLSSQQSSISTVSHRTAAYLLSGFCFSLSVCVHSVDFLHQQYSFSKTLKKNTPFVLDFFPPIDSDFTTAGEPHVDEACC